MSLYAPGNRKMENYTEFQNLLTYSTRVYSKKTKFRKSTSSRSSFNMPYYPIPPHRNLNYFKNYVLDAEIAVADLKRKLNQHILQTYVSLTPLQKAAILDNPETIEKLVANGDNVDNASKFPIPLLLAAAQGSWKSVHALIRFGANIFETDSLGCNILHLVIIKGGCVSELADKSCFDGQLKQLVDGKDNDGFSPLHFACLYGNLKAVEDLIRLGACLNVKNNKKENPLHYAVMGGSYCIVKTLLASEKDSDMINDIDEFGSTPLHYASSGQSEILNMLLNLGAEIKKDVYGRNALHFAALKGCKQSITFLLEMYPHLLDEEDQDQNTALHLAAIGNNTDAIQYLLSKNCQFTWNKWYLNALKYAIRHNCPETVLLILAHNHYSKESNIRLNSYIIEIIIYLPQVLEDILDKHLMENKGEKNNTKFGLRHLFIKKNLIVRYNRNELLVHPLCQRALQDKWNKYGKQYYVRNLFFYLALLFWITMLAIMMVNNTIILTEDTSSKLLLRPSVNSTINNSLEVESLQRTIGINIVAIILLAENILFYVRVYRRNFKSLFKRKNNTSIMIWALHIITLVMVITVFLNDERITVIRYTVSSIAVFLAWFNFLLYLDKFAEVGIYVQIFRKVLGTSIKLLMMFSILIIGFGLVFYILMSNKKNTDDNHLSFSNIPMSLFRTLSMMLGEFDVADTYVETFFNHQLKVPIPTFVFLCLFMVLMPILSMNLFIGLAVGDIEAIRRDAQMSRLRLVGKLLYEIEPRDEKPNRSFLNKMFERVFRLSFNKDYEIYDPDDVMEAKLLEKIEKNHQVVESKLKRQEELLSKMAESMKIGPK